MWLILTMLCIVVNASFTQHEDCTVESPSGLYDFSGLSWKPWVVMGIQNTTFFYTSVSLCNRTYLTPCGVVSICVIDKNNSTWSALENSFIVEEKKNNSEMKVSARLRDRNVDTATTLTVDVTLICDDKVGELHFKKFEKNVMFLSWQTVAACPIKHPSYYNCIIDDSKVGKINLRPLRHLQYYTATDEQNEYYVNICGGTVGSLCGNITGVAGCKVDSENKTQILGFASKQHLKKELDLQFRNKTKKITMKVELVCNSRIPHGELKFISYANSVYIFELETSLVCISKLMDCSCQDESNLKYNLTSLSEMEDTVYHKQNITYILSICRSVKHNLCSNGSSVCLINGTSSISLGTLNYGPEMNENLRIVSSGGDYCNVHNLRYRSVIIFICSYTKVLRLANVSLDCVYTFMWYTKAACPSAFEIGSNCFVHDPVHGLTFNLKPLHNPHGSYVIINGNGDSQFDLNVCEELSKPCNGSRNVGVCLTDREGRQYPIGNRAVSPHYNDGRLSFVLKGKGCRSDHTSSTVHIIFLCSQSATKSSPEFWGQHDNCSFFFVWHTVLACAQFVAYDCKISDDKGQTYDLRPLILPDEDYTILSNTTKGFRKFIINVCRPVIYRHEARCSPQSGVCLQDLTEPNYQKSFTNLGEASGLQYDKDKRVLKVEYTGGGICTSGAEAEYRSVITFLCDKKGNKTSVPILSKESGCLYEFEWKTKLACSKEEETDLQYNNCKLINFDEGIILDLSSFVNRERIVKSSSGEVFRFVVCGSLNKTNTKGVGVCHEKGGNCENIGMVNTDLHYKNGRLYLNYTNGVNCTANARKYTIIEFICETKEMLEIIYSSISCEYNIKWHSNLACVSPCITDGQRKINLSILNNNENNYKTTINGTSYFINVCKPLIHEEGLHCSNISAVCKTVHQSARSWSDEVDLGHSQHRPIFLGGNVVLNYSSTSSCMNYSSQNLDSSIIFVCDPLAGFGSPILNHVYLNCKYEFLWKTSVTCEDYIFHFASTYSDKILNNSLSNTHINLQSLCRSKKYKVENYFIDMCDIFLCKIEKLEDQKEISYGKAEYAAFSYSQNVTKLFLTGGDECHSQSAETYSAVVILTCTTSAENQIQILKESNCSVQFEWRTPVACSHSSAPTDHKVITSTNITRSQTSVVAVVAAIIMIVIVCLVVYILNKSALRNWCRIKMNRLYSRRHEGEYHYDLVSRFYTKEL